MRKDRIACALIVLVSSVVSCNRTPEKLGPEDFKAWYFSEASGLHKSKNIRDMEVSAALLPNAYLAYREYEADPGGNYDSIVKSYQCGLTFQVTLTADKKSKLFGNLLYYGLTSEEEMQARIKYLNFNIAEFLSVKHANVAYEPVLSNFDGYDPLGNKLRFQAVFIIPEYNCGKPREDFNSLQLTFQDPFWETGKSHFEFNKKIIQDIPELIR